jgi:hypothetical protein
MSDETEAKILALLDVIAIEVGADRNDTRALDAKVTSLSVDVAANRAETTELRMEMRGGFNRVDRRLGNLETRVEGVETELRLFRGEFERRIAPLER